MFENVGAIVMYVDDIKETEVFYARLGFQAMAVSADHLRIQIGQCELEFHNASTELIEEFRVEASRRPRGAGLYIYIRVARLHELHARIKSNDNNVASEIFARPWGNEEFYVEDPSGYNLAFYSRLT